MEESKNDQEFESMVPAIRLAGRALESIEGVLGEMGGYIGGYNPVADIRTPGNGTIAIYVAMSFDAEKLAKYLDPSGSEAPASGHEG
jgi:hypothetical protein